MLVIFANAADEQARHLKVHLGADRALLAFPRDLSIPGWTLNADCPQEATFIAEGGRHRVSDVHGLVLRLPCVSEHDLVHMHESDRAYAAAEMTAFLLSWTRITGVPTLNTPDPLCLAGPALDLPRWQALATRYDLHPEAGQWSQAPSEGRAVPGTLACHTVTVVGNTSIGDSPASCHDFARRLAHACGAGLLAVRFEQASPSPRWLGADPWPDVADERVADAIRCHFEGRIP